MAKHVERKRGARGREETLRRKRARQDKYAMRELNPLELSLDLAIDFDYATAW